jgi:hypothetical protein
MELSEISRVGRRHAAHLFGEHFGQVEKNVCKRMVVELRTKIEDLDKAEACFYTPLVEPSRMLRFQIPGRFEVDRTLQDRNF